MGDGRTMRRMVAVILLVAGLAAPTWAAEDSSAPTKAAIVAELRTFLKNFEARQLDKVLDQCLLPPTRSREKLKQDLADAKSAEALELSSAGVEVLARIGKVEPAARHVPERKLTQWTGLTGGPASELWVLVAKDASVAVWHRDGTIKFLNAENVHRLAAAATAPAGPGKARICAALRELLRRLQAGDYQQAAAFLVLPADTTPEEIERELKGLLAQEEVSANGIDILERVGDYGPASRFHDPKRLAEWADQVGGQPSDLWAIGAQNAMVVAHVKGEQVKFLRLNNVGRLKDQPTKAMLIRALRTIMQHIREKRYDQAAALFHVPEESQQNLAEEISELVADGEISESGIDVLEKIGEFGEATKFYPSSRVARWAKDVGGQPSEFWAVGTKEAVAVAWYKDGTLKFVRVNNIGRLAEED